MITSVIFTAFLTLLFLYFFIKKKKNKAIEQVTDPVTGRKRVRIFEGHFERGVHDNLYQFGEALLSNVVCIESTVPLQKADIATALVALAKKHPLLRMRCEWGHDCQRYFTEIRLFTQNELLYSEENVDDWVGRFEQELQQGYDLACGPLWRVVRIQESFDSSTNKYNSTFLFSFHHSICDEMSVLNLLDQLLEILDHLHWKNFEEENLPSLPLLPPMLELVKHHTHLSWWESIVLRINFKLQSLKGLQNRFLDMFPPPLVHNPTMTARTFVIPGSLTKEQTALLVKNCKTYKCTVTGTLAVCYASAISKMALEFGAKMTKIDIGFPVNVRKGCKPVVSDNDLGVFIGIVFLCLTASKNLALKQCFWDQAKKISSELKQQLSANRQYGVSTALGNGLFNTAQNYESAKKNIKYAGRYPNFELTNCGNLSLDKTRMYTLKKVHFAVSQNVVGPIITISSVTVNGVLHWSVIYSDAAVCEEHARRFSQLFYESVIHLCCDN